jgi:voltage-gated potassium channel
MATAQHPPRYFLSGIVFTIVVVVLVAFAVSSVVDLFFIVMLVGMIVGTTAMYLAFPGSGFFCIALANFLSVYTCLFAFFLEVNFVPGDRLPVIIAYVLPIVAFNAGTFYRRTQIRSIITGERLRETRHPARWFKWLFPVFSVGALTFLIPALNLSLGARDALLVGAMGIISIVVLLVSRDVAIFLIDVGLMFEDFFRRMAQMILPTVGFFTFYTTNIIVFGCIYRIMDQYSAVHHFSISGVMRDITFPESLYFSVVTLSTVGYGEIVPVSNVARVVAAVQIVLGVLLLLFGFYEIMSYARERRRGGDD